MPVVSISIHGKQYQIACDVGQEAHVEKLAGRISKRMGDIASQLGKATSDNMLLILTALMMEEEIHQIKQQVMDRSAPSPIHDQNADPAVIASIDQATKRVETVAKMLKNA